MEFHLVVTDCVGSLSTIINGLFVLLILVSPPDNIGIFRSQYYVGAFAGFFFAATQLWSANLFFVNGTFFAMFSARDAGTIGFLSFSAAFTLQFSMLSSNFAVRYAAVRGGWLRYYLTNQWLFYGVQVSGVLGAFVPPVVLMSPTPELRISARDTCGEMFPFDFMTKYYFVSSYEHLSMNSLFIHSSIFLMVVLFQGANLFIMLVCGVVTYLYISKNTQSQKLRNVNNRLLFARSFQAFFAFLFIFTPGLFINVSMLLRLDASHYSGLLSSMMSFGTLFNPIVDVALTPSYRRRIMGTILRRTETKSVPEASTIHLPLRRTASKTVIVRIK